MQTVRCFRIRVAIMVLALLVAGAALAQRTQGIWRERHFRFPVSLLREAGNTLTLTGPKGRRTAGVVCGCLRLELATR